MATALELAIDSKHPEPLGYDADVKEKERGATPTTSGTTCEFASEFFFFLCERILTTISPTAAQPTLNDYMRHAEVARAREAGATTGM